MTEVSLQHDVRYTRPVPQEWGELVDYSRDQLDPSDPRLRTPAMAEAMLERLSELDNEKLDTVRYYGIGLVMCGIARALRDPDTRTRIVQEAGGRLFKNWRAGGTVDRDSLQPADISSFSTMMVFWDIANRAGESLPEEVQHLNDALFVEADERRSAIGRAEREVRLTTGQPEQPRGISAVLSDVDIAVYRSSVREGREWNSDWAKDGSIKRGLTSEFVGKNVTAGASDVLCSVLDKRAAFTAAQSPLVVDKRGNVILLQP